MRAFVTVLLLLTALAAATPVRADVALEPPAGQAEVWSTWELALHAPAVASGESPFDARVRATVVEPGGRRVELDGFCDSADGTMYRVRVMPTSPGRHRVDVTFDRAGSRASFVASFDARASKRRGPVRVDAQHPFHFVWQGTGEHYFWNGTTAYLLLGWDDATIDRNLDRLAALKVNRVRLGLSVRKRAGSEWHEPAVTPRPNFALHVAPWVAARPDSPDDPGFDVTRFDVPMWQKLDRLVSHARERDVVVSLIFYVDGASGPGVDPFGRARAGGADEQRYYRYAISRLAAYSNVMWDLTNEYRLFRDDAWAEAMGAFVERTDPYAHLTSVHGHADFRFRRSKWADFAVYQQWDDCGGHAFMLQNRIIQSLLGRPMPQVNEEYGYEDHYPPFGCGSGGVRVAPGRDAENRRMLAWDIAMAGGYQTAGERANVPGQGGWITGAGDDSMVLFRGYAKLVDFFTRYEWWKLEPHVELTGPGTKPTLAEPGRLYVVRLQSGGSVYVRLAPGRYRAVWYDPRNGVDVPIGELTATGTETRWTSPQAPNAKDWTLVVERVR